MHSINRRQFLGGSLCALGASWMPRSIGPRKESDKIVVVIQLAGGNDGLATVTPKEDDIYYRSRPTISVRKNELLPLDDLNGFHPALVRTARRFERGQVCIRQGIGHPNSNLSHFRSRDIWDSASTAANLPPTGWIGRANELHAARTGGVALIAAGTGLMPLALRDSTSSACVVDTLETYRIRSRNAEVRRGVDHARIRAMEALQIDRTSGPLAELHQAWVAAQGSIKELRRADGFPLRRRFGGGELGNDLETVASVIGTELDAQCFYVTQGGYDTHAGQPASHRKHLSQLDEALDDFLREMERQGNLDRVLVLAISEFGRRVEESGIGSTAGTDHGAGNCLLAFGGQVHAGLHGGQPDLANLDEHGNLLYHSDFRGVYGNVLDDWLQVDSTQVLGKSFDKVQVVRHA